MLVIPILRASCLLLIVQVIMSSDLLNCPFCGTDKEHFDTVPFADENCEYIMCSVCGKFLTSVAKCDDTVFLDAEHKENCGQCDQGVLNDQNENVIDISDVSCEIVPVEGYEAGCVSLPLSPNCHQMLRSSCSAFNFEEQQNARVGAAGRSASLDSGDLSGDSLKQTRDLYCRRLSCGCSSPGSQLLPVEGLKGIFSCSGCSLVHGIDDSMNYYDLLQKGDYVVEACDVCGNSNADLFLVEAGITPDSINLRCMKCCDMARESLSESVGDMEITEEENLSILDGYIKEWIHYECKCENSNSDLQKVSVDYNSSTVFVKCWVCEREEMIKLDFKRKGCTCNSSDCVDVRFDEFGYASQLVCLKCHTEMDCGAPNIGDIPAAGDGASIGRMRISSISEIHVGDHIAWHQTLGYWHHAIVTQVNGAQIRVVHYNGPSLPNKGR